MKIIYTKTGSPDAAEIVSLRKGFPTTAITYRGLPFLIDYDVEVQEWIEENIQDHASVVAVLILNSAGSLWFGAIYGTFADDEDAMLFKLRWEGTR